MKRYWLFLFCFGIPLSANANPFVSFNGVYHVTKSECSTQRGDAPAETVSLPPFDLEIAATHAPDEMVLKMNFTMNPYRRKYVADLHLGDGLYEKDYFEAPDLNTASWNSIYFQGNWAGWSYFKMVKNPDGFQVHDFLRIYGQPVEQVLNECTYTAEKKP